MIDKFELTILSNLIHNEEFARKAIPFLKEDFFKDRIETIVLNHEHTQYSWENVDKEKGLTLPPNFDKDIKPILVGMFGVQN